MGKSTNIVEKLDDSYLTFIKRALLQHLIISKTRINIQSLTIHCCKQTSTSSCNTGASETESVGGSVVLSSSKVSLFEMQSTSSKEHTPAGGTGREIAKVILYLKLLKEPNYKICWPLLEQTERQL